MNDVDITMSKLRRKITMSKLRRKESLADIDYDIIIAVIDNYESMWDEAQGIIAKKRELEHKLEKIEIWYRKGRTKNKE